MSVDISLPVLKPTDFASDQDVRWCPGCGDYSILAQMKKIMPSLGIPREKIVFISGIGCSSRFPYYMNTYGIHSIHGRAPAVATGLKTCRPDLNVWVITGDGDGLSIGGNHLMHTARRNIDITYLVMNNQIYGLTTGQISPTSRPDMKTKSTPFGNLEFPINPITSAIMNGAPYVARGYSADPKHLTELIKGGIQHKGFALIDVFSPCVTFNHDNDFAFFKPRIRKLEDDGHDPHDWKEACEKAMAWGDEIYIGLFHHNARPSLDSLEMVLDDDVPIARRSLGLSSEQGETLIGRMM